MATMAHAVNDPKFNTKALCEKCLPTQIVLKRVWDQFPNVSEIECGTCRQILSNRPVNKGNVIGQQIREDMRRRYGPSIEDPEWATEGFVPR